MTGSHRRWITALLSLALLLGSWLLPVSQPAAAASGAYDVVLVEHLRIKVPANAVEAWI